ncbi:methionyl aminopeptidase [Coprinopsis marcescibilis]|uniref:Methionine aminopeptidase n=1 Tax=Coprinopsis marcescibilis TaxID=230819 RepID=A0A5C3L7K1_COPMA|nr:methionyl aminopeptidase [Coprinopsis marcescibilis]
MIEDFGDYRVILPEEPYVFGTAHIKTRSVPAHIQRPYYAFDPPCLDKRPAFKGKIALGTEEEGKLREAAKLAKKVREYAGSLVKVGITTNAIDEAIHEFIVAHGAYPSPLLYNDFPKSCCTSINNVLVHGIPDDHPLQDGDIINIDVTIYKDGFHGDTSQTFAVGSIDPKASDLIQTTNACLQAGIAACGPNRLFRDIGKAIHTLLTTKSRAGTEYSVSTQFSGHGIGPVFHSIPWILHHKNDEPGIMEPGHCFTIEPCIIQGSNPRGWIFPDGWTASTENTARSAQAEHMVLITHDGAEVLTA